MPATRPCGSSASTSVRKGRRSTSFREKPPGTAARRLHAVYFTTDTNSGRTGRFWMRKIVPPTSQNQKSIEKDLWEVVPRYLEGSHEELTLRCEQTVRNHDPCISCATHFLKLHLERG